MTDRLKPDETMRGPRTRADVIRLRRIRKSIALRETAKTYAYAVRECTTDEIAAAERRLNAAAIAYARDLPRRKSSEKE